MNEHRGLWRGKRIDNSEWVYGTPLQHCDGDWQLISGKVGAMVIQTVIADTLGECTGLRDKNGKLIFEGDIISEKPLMNTVAYVGYVKYDAKLTAFKIVFDNPNVVHVLGAYSTSYTIIGNIHDNPELLKVTGEDIGNAEQDTIAPAT